VVPDEQRVDARENAFASFVANDRACVAENFVGDGKRLA
jgi:hypothetical protein